MLVLVLPRPRDGDAGGLRVKRLARSCYFKLFKVVNWYQIRNDLPIMWLSLFALSVPVVKNWLNSSKFGHFCMDDFLANDCLLSEAISDEEDKSFQRFLESKKAKTWFLITYGTRKMARKKSWHRTTILRTSDDRKSVSRTMPFMFLFQYNHVFLTTIAWWCLFFQILRRKQTPWLRAV